MQVWRYRLNLCHTPEWEYFDNGIQQRLSSDTIDRRKSMEFCSTIFCKVSGWVPGWYIIELDAGHQLPFEQVTFRLNSEDVQAHLAHVNLRQGMLAKRLVYIPASTRTIYLEPSLTGGCLTLRYCNFVWVTRRFAFDRMLRRLNAVHSQFKGVQRKSILQTLKREARESGKNWKDWLTCKYEDTFRHFRPDLDYSAWLTLSSERSCHSKAQSPVEPGELEGKPGLNILLTVGQGVDLQLLSNTVDSVLNQLYGNWQLIIRADDAQFNEIESLLALLGEADSRIQLVSTPVLCSSKITNESRLEKKFTIFLEVGDQLAPDALLYTSQSLHANPGVQLLYSDDDLIDRLGQRSMPRFKPSWNPDLLLSQDYISGFIAYSTERLRRIGGIRDEFGTSRYYDLLLRFTRDLSAERVVHVPLVLCHRAKGRGLEKGSRLLEPPSGLLTVTQAVRHQDEGAVVIAGRVPESYHVQWSLPDPPPLVSLLVPTRDRVDILRPCIDTILRHTTYTNFEIIILDNGSRCPDTLEYMHEVSKTDGRVRVLSWSHPFNYSAINNFGARHALGSILGLVNNDVEPINPDWMTEMVRQVSRLEVGCVGAKLYYPDERVQHAGVILGLSGVAGHAHKFYKRGDSGYCERLQLVQNFSAVTAACLFVRRSVFDEVDGLNERDLRVAFNDVDFCLKVQEAGYRNLWTPYAELYHHESLSRGADETREKRERFLKEVQYMRSTWGHLLDSDPAYNPNLTRDYEDFSLRNLYK